MDVIKKIMNIADVIRRRQGKTWRQIAKESGVNYRTISAWKCGRASFTIGTCPYYTKHLGKTRQMAVSQQKKDMPIKQSWICVSKTTHGNGGGAAARGQ